MVRIYGDASSLGLEMNRNALLRRQSTPLLNRVLRVFESSQNRKLRSYTRKKINEYFSQRTFLKEED